jgi:hypothetical protein
MMNHLPIARVMMMMNHLPIARVTPSLQMIDHLPIAKMTTVTRMDQTMTNLQKMTNYHSHKLLFYPADIFIWQN